jgi:pantoate--beta-alanine ligase
MAGSFPVEEIKKVSEKNLSDHGFVVDYFEIADVASLQPVSNWNESEEVIACVAAFLGPVRLIDNMILFRIFAG